MTSDKSEPTLFIVLLSHISRLNCSGSVLGTDESAIELPSTHQMHTLSELLNTTCRSHQYTTACVTGGYLNTTGLHDT